MSGDDSLRYAGVEVAVHRMLDDLEREVGQTRSGRVALCLVRLWARRPHRGGQRLRRSQRCRVRRRARLSVTARL